MPASKPILSFSNLVASATVTASSEDAAWGKENARTPHLPFLVWRSAGVGTDQWLAFDFGSAKAIGAMGFVNANFASARIQGGDTGSTWPFDQAITVRSYKRTGRYQFGTELTTFTRRHLRLYIPAQTPTDGASYFQTGGVWAGVSVPAPDQLVWGEEFTAIDPHEDIEGDGGQVQRLLLGEPVTIIRADRRTKVAEVPGLDDALESWHDLDRQMWANAFFFFLVNLGHSAHAWVFRVDEMSGWKLEENARMASSRLTLKEVVGP